MTFFHRFVTLAKADAHGVLDSLEDRSLVLKQCLRDAELELAQKRVRQEELSNWVELLARQREQLESRASALDDDIRLAIERDQDALARFSIRRLLATRRGRELLEEPDRDAKGELGRLTPRIDAQQRQLEELRERVETHLARERALDRQPRTCPLPGDPEASHSAGVHDEEVELELLRRRQEGEGGGARA